MNQALNIDSQTAVPTDTNQATAISLSVEHLSLQLADRDILSDISFTLPESGIISLIGPSGAGKSTLLRCLNRLHEQWQGEIILGTHNIRLDDADILRRKIGLIGQKPAVFPCSIRDNVIFGLNRQQRKKINNKQINNKQIQAALQQAALWTEVEQRLDEPATHLSLGQQQRLCLARALILEPSMLLLDEPTSALDPRSRDIIEHSMTALSQHMPLLWVSHDLEQAQRISSHIIFICDGKLIETADAKSFFNHPKRIESREFLRWSVCDC